MGAGLGVSKGVVVPGEVITAGCRYGLELMIGEPVAEVPSAGCEGVMENIIRIVHPVDPEDGLEAAFIKAGVVGNQWEVFNERLNLFPHPGEDRCVIGVLRP